MTLEELKEGSDVLLSATPARRLAEQVIMLSTLLDHTTLALEKYQINKGLTDGIRAQHRQILMGPEDGNE